MKKEHMNHDVYTLYCLKNLVSMFKEHSDKTAGLYGVALNVLTLLSSEGLLTRYENHRLSEVFSHLSSVSRWR